jgi:uncharacterized protein YukE
MPIPSNYDSSTIDVDPWPLHSAAAKVHDAISGINDDMTAITNKLNELRLSWVGKSSDEADKFNKDWNDIWKRLYGTKDDPDQGILNRFASGLTTAAVTYSRGERAVSDSFARFQAALEGLDPTTWNLPPDADIEDALGKHPVPKPDPNAGDYTDHPPPENTVIDGPEEYADEMQHLESLDVKNLPDPHVHTTAVDETF